MYSDVCLEIPPGCPQPSTWPPLSGWWDLVVVACSGGKDSRVLLHRAYHEYPRDRLLVIYNLLGNEHPGSPQEVADWCADLGLPLLYTWKDENNRSRYGPEVPPAYTHLDADLVVNLAEGRGRWPDRSNPLCTSTGKRDTTDVLIRHAGDDLGGRKILLLTGERAGESAARARKPEWQLRGATSPRKGRLVVWHRAMLRWTEAEVWDYLRRHRIPVPASYAQGFPRHSCIHCIHKSWEEMCLAFVLHPEPAARRVAAEERMGHRVNLRYRYQGYTGFRAVWELVYGPWTGEYAGQSPRPEGLEAIRRWRENGRLFRLPGDVQIA